uniref:Homeobox domain-containing protein n=1 Tax=Biomphalaria glabrata TaxID=6526 RepID=A0A2C9K0J8_BIOGL
MTMSKSEDDDGRDKYEPIKRLAMVQIQPPRNPCKPFTSFCIKDILGSADKDPLPDKLVIADDRYKHQHQVNNSCHNGIGGLQAKCKSSLSRGSDNGSVYNSGHRHLSHNVRAKHGYGGRDDTSELLNRCKSDYSRETFRAALTISPVMKSPTNGRSKALLPGLTSPLHHFSHRGLLQLSPQTKPLNLRTKIVRPWDTKDSEEDAPCSRETSTPTTGALLTPNNGAILTASEASSEDEDEEISVDDDDPPPPPTNVAPTKKNNSVSPLDALMAMTSKTFEGLEGSGTSDAKRRDQATLFGKHQPPKKRRKSRTAFTNQQIYELEKRFLYQKYLTPADRDEIAASLGLTNAQVITWFQNRRAKLKRDLEELKNDVTAAKKLPLSKTMTGSIAEIELRKVQEKTLRDSFNNGGLQSPSSSMASLSDDCQDVTPGHSPGNTSELNDDLIVSRMKSDEPMDTRCCDETDEEIDNDLSEDERPNSCDVKPSKKSFCHALDDDKLDIQKKFDLILQNDLRSGSMIRDKVQDIDSVS